jgi:hypothetical protein
MSGKVAAAVIALILVLFGIIVWRLIVDPHAHCVVAGKVPICWRDHQ